MWNKRRENKKERKQDRRAPNSVTVVKKGKAVPLQTWSGPDGSRKLRFSDFMTTAQDGGEVVSPMSLPPGNTPGIHFC
jgi:hypothetical protein